MSGRADHRLYRDTARPLVVGMVSASGSEPTCQDMVDKITPAERSALMGRIRGKNTVPEMLVRRTAHRMGYRFRLHRRDLPGSPDLVFPARRRAIFVHGCFWHGHEGCRRSKIPETRSKYWALRIERNKLRDCRAVEQLEALGWSVLLLWECQLRDERSLETSLKTFLGPPGQELGIDSTEAQP